MEYLLALERDTTRWDVLAALQLERTGFRSGKTCDYRYSNAFSCVSHACDPAVRIGRGGQPTTEAMPPQTVSQTSDTVPLRPLFYRWRISKHDTVRPTTAKAWPGSQPFQSLDCSSSATAASTSSMPAASDCPDHGAILVARQRPRQASPILVPVDAPLAAVSLDPARVLISLRICENMGPVLYRFPLPLLDASRGLLAIPYRYDSGSGNWGAAGPVRDVGCIAVPLCV